MENENVNNTDETAQAQSAAAEETPEALLKQEQEKYLYLYAEFETYKKRMAREKSDLLKFGNERLIREILQVVDNLQRALQFSQTGDALVEGIKMVEQQLKDALTQFGLKPITSLGAKFDPALHEAIAQQESADVEDGIIIKEELKGYLLHERLLRPARVVIAKKI